MGKRVATNVRLPVSLHKKAKLYALREGKSLAEVVREAVSEYVADPGLRPEQLAKDPFFAVIGVGESDEVTGASPKDSSSLHVNKGRGPGRDTVREPRAPVQPQSTFPEVMDPLDVWSTNGPHRCRCDRKPGCARPARR